MYDNKLIELYKVFQDPHKTTQKLQSITNFEIKIEKCKKYQAKNNSKIQYVSFFRLR